KRNSDLLVRAFVAATRVTGVLACGSSGSVPPCPFALTTNPRLAIQLAVQSAICCKVCTHQATAPGAWRDGAHVRFCPATIEVIRAASLEAFVCGAFL